MSDLDGSCEVIEFGQVIQNANMPPLFARVRSGLVKVMNVLRYNLRRNDLCVKKRKCFYFFKALFIIEHQLDARTVHYFIV